jgi:hypothetical protein
MSKMSTFMRTAAALVAGIAAVFAAATHAVADKVHLKDGQVIEGRIEREEGGHVWIVETIGKISHTRFIMADQIAKIERDSDAAPKAEAVKAAEPVRTTNAPRTGKATRVAILNFGPPGDWASKGKKVGDMVGVQVAAQPFREAIPLLEADQVDVVVLRINSGGGMLLEIPKINDLLHYEYKKRFRTVGWVESAISAAAMSPYCLEEFYFMPKGNLGACTGWYGALQAVEGVELLEVLHMMERYSQRGGRDPKIMRSMQIMEPLSCTIDENGDVHWFQDLSGDHIVNPENRILTFNSIDAVKYKFARGIAATKEELVELMGLQEVEWVGQRAADLVDNFMIATTDTENRLREVLAKYNMALAAAQGSPPDRRGAEVGKARRYLEELRRMIKVADNFKLLLGVDDEWFEVQEENLRRLLR